MYLFISNALIKEHPPCSPKVGPLYKQTSIPESSHGVVYLWIVLSPEEASFICPCFGK
jgi:hypothetical protein